MSRIKVVRYVEYIRFQTERKRTHVTVGAFDGIHVGHQKLIRKTVDTARANRAMPAVLTFQNHPLTILAPSYAPMRLSSDEARTDLFESMGVRILVLIPFNRSVADLSPEKFVEDILVHGLRVRHLVCGYNFHFGKNGAGNVDVLAELGKKHDFTVEKVPPVKVRGVVVSSTKIRELLTQGMVSTVAEFLGRPYTIRGVVKKGFGRGRSLHYPTANLDLPRDLLIPAEGVYAVRVVLKNGGEYGAMMNIGHNPSFPGDRLSVEVHLFDFDGDLIGETMEIKFVNRLRIEMKYEKIEDLMDQLKRDETSARKFLSIPGS